MDKTKPIHTNDQLCNLLTKTIWYIDASFIILLLERPSIKQQSNHSRLDDYSLTLHCKLI